MALTPGTRLGPYEIVAPLGAGGMGEVYRARDPRLGREVAIKILPIEFSADEDRRQRFEREAQTVSRLTHPHICPLYDVGREGAVEYLVMELIEGETLAERLAKGRLPLDQVLRHGAEIASALASAHARKVVHRDLKPSNIMLTRTGVKLLDFGLAQAFSIADEGSTAATASIAIGLTEEGTRLGTAPYMAPEQVEGRAVDAKADVFALGAVLYEMASGVRAFGGTSQAAVMSAVLTHDPPPLPAQRPGTPPALDRLVRRCLAKDPVARWNSAADLEFQLREMLGTANGAGAEVTAAPAARRWAGLPWALAAVAVAFALFGLMRRPAAIVGAAPSIRFTIAPPEGGAFSYQSEAPYLAVSPDGSQIAYLATDAGGPGRIFVRPLASLEVRPLAGTELASSLFWSPDGQSLGFFTNGKLRRVDVSGGTPSAICDVPPGGGLTGSWGQGGVIVFSSILGREIWSVPASGGTPRVVVRADGARGEWRAGWPCYLPDGERFLYLLRRSDSRDSLMLFVPGRRATGLLACTSKAAFTEPDLLTYVEEGSLYGRRFNWRSGDLRGGPFAIADPVRYFLSTGGAAFATSAGGTLVYQSTADVSVLTWLDRGGRELGTLGTPANYLDATLSSDGLRVLCSRTEPRIETYDVWSIDLERGTETRLTSSRNSEFDARLLPGGRSIVYSAVEGGLPLLHRLDLVTGKSEPLLAPTGFQWVSDVSNDGRMLAYIERTAGGSIRAWGLPLTGGGQPSPLLTTGSRASAVRFSPDSRFVAFLSDESGRDEVYVAPFPGPGERTRVSSDGALTLRWSRGSGEILYLSQARRLVSVPVRTSPALRLGTPTPLFTLRENGVWAGFDVTPDGQRILAVVPKVSGDKSPLTVITDWPRAIGK